MDTDSHYFSGTVDGLDASVIVDLHQAQSYVSFRLLPRLPSAPYALRRVMVPSLTNEASFLGMIPYDPGQHGADILLGRDWFNAVKIYDHMASVMSSSSRVHNVGDHVTRIFDSSCVGTSIYGDDLQTIREFSRLHGLNDVPCDLQVARARLLRHLFCGMCANGHGIHHGCSDLVHTARSHRRSDIAVFCASKLLHMGSRCVIDNALYVTCSSLFPAIVSDTDDAVDHAHLIWQFANMLSDLTTWNKRVGMQDIEGMSPEEVRVAAAAHNISFITNNIDSLRSDLMAHILSTNCTGYIRHPVKGSSLSSASPCRDYSDDLSIVAEGLPWLRTKTHSLRLGDIETMLVAFPAKSLRRLACVLGIEIESSAHARRARRVIKDHIRRERKGKTLEFLPPVLQPPKRNRPASCGSVDGRTLESVDKERSVERPPWPRVTPTHVKRRLLSLFRKATSKDALESFTCAACGGAKMVSSGRVFVQPSTTDLSPLRINGTAGVGIFSTVDADGPLKDLALDRRGVRLKDATQEPDVDLCKTCHRCISRGVVPALALANDILLGEIPPELADLTPVEETMIARCRSKTWVLHLREGDGSSLGAQRGMKGHIIVYPQHPEGLRDVLPPSSEELASYICVVFVGVHKPSNAWLTNNASPLLVRQDRIRRALRFLKANNPLYANVDINEEAISQLPAHAIMPFEVHHQSSDAASSALTDSYDSSSSTTESDPRYANTAPPENATFSGVVVADVNENSSSKDMKTAAVRHLKDSTKSHIAMPHDPLPVREFNNPDLFPMIFPTLFPYGRGGFETGLRERQIKMERHVRHLLNMTDRRFQEHFSFIFVVFNMLQRKKALLFAKFKVESAHFKRVANDINSISIDTFRSVMEKVDRGERIDTNSVEESRVLRLMREVKLVTAQVDGSASGRTAMRNEIRGMMMTNGLPSFFLTINPADVYNPLVKFLAGSDIDVDNLMPSEVPTYKDQAILIAKNPIVAAKFFDLIMRAFIEHILGVGSNDALVQQEGGILGKVKSYYGCVEAQGRGTLHCHMLIWIEGALNPNEIRDRIIEEGESDFSRGLIDMLDDLIATELPPTSDERVSVPSDNFHPCSVRGIDPESHDYEIRREKDLHNLAKCCQVHSHTLTCYKYWKGPPEPKECRFDLDESNVRPLSVIDPETGEIKLRCLNGLVNNFNHTILEAMRCNMDLKFIGSGQSAKAVLYYITDYITKTQLKAHVAYAALELAAKRLEGNDTSQMAPLDRAKKLLQKCAYAMLSHQELSAQQVSSYLMGYGDHYTNGEFRHLWWTSFESIVNKKYPAEGPDDDVSVDPMTLPEEYVPTIEAESISQLLQSLDVSLQNDNGTIVGRSGQVSDYLCRDPSLANLNVWDFISTCDKVKVKIGSTRTDIINDNDEENDEVGRDIVADDVLIGDKGDRRRTKLYEFTELHGEKATHRIRIRSVQRRLIPVPIGPAIPRRDVLEVRERYCRLMMILFKPWIKPEDLKTEDKTWSESFEEFSRNCPSSVLGIMDNMQLLHECKDSRDDHFANRRKGLTQRSDNISTLWINDDQVVTEEDELRPDDSVEDLIEHLHDISSMSSIKRQRLDKTAEDCTLRLESAGLFDFGNPDSMDLDNALDEFSHNVSNLKNAGGLEAQWKRTYESRKKAAKQNLVLTDVAPETTTTESQIRTVNRSSGEKRIDPYVQEHMAVDEDTVRPGYRVNEEHSYEDSQRMTLAETIAHVKAEFALNKEQGAAYDLISQRVDKSSGSVNAPLRLYIGGPGGTGKSRIIQAISALFNHRNESGRLRLAAYTGVAASNIRGVTLHSALKLNEIGNKLSAKGRQELCRMWEGVDFLIIDEVSMIGCDLLYQIHHALTIAKGKNVQFGGVNVIFAGDFAQLPPIGQTRLFSKVTSSGNHQGAVDSAQRNLLGRLLWLDVDNIVMLHQPMRQSSKDAKKFVDLLTRLRKGDCDEADYKLLCDRVLTSDLCKNTDMRPWVGSMTLVADNATKDAINEAASLRFIERTKARLETYYSLDYQANGRLDDPAIIYELSQYHTGDTKHRARTLILSPGMPVILSQNYDVTHGAVNGTFGTVQRVRYTVDKNGERFATSCIIRSSDFRGDPLPYLGRGEIAVLPDIVDIKFENPESHKKLNIKRKQLPLLPRFALTIHKAQGLTLDKVVVDLEGCNSIESAYVMLSRARKLEDIVILRPFKLSRIQGNISDDLSSEYSRLETLHRSTLQKLGIASPA